MAKNRKPTLPKKDTEKSNTKTLIIIAIIGAIATVLAATIPALVPVIVTQKLPTETQFATMIFTQPSISTATNFLFVDTLQPSPASIEIIPLTSTPASNEIIDGKVVPMMLVPAGDFVMGSNNGEINEQPVHQVFLEAFYIDKYEVTNSQYRVCVNLGACRPLSDELFYQNPKYAEHPVTFVDWHLAKAFCAWREARLPTEAEWEKAARGSNEFNYPWGNTIDCTYANYRGANGWCEGESKPVGAYENGKSMFGVYDLVGNAAEWVSSVFVEYPYDANDGREGLNAGGLRVIRGGSWNNREDNVRITVRADKSPSAAEHDFGFRCAKDAP